MDWILYCLPSTGQTFARLRDEWLVCRIFLLGKVTSKVTRSTNPHAIPSCGATLGRSKDLEDFLIENPLNCKILAVEAFLHRFASYNHWWQKISGYHCMKWHPDGMILAAGTQAIRKSLGRNFAMTHWNWRVNLSGEMMVKLVINHLPWCCLES